MISSEALALLEKTYRSQEVALITLVEAQLKPGGEIRSFGSNIFTAVDLSYHFVFGNKNHALIWKGDLYADPKTIETAFFKGGGKAWGQFAGYPSCCIDSFGKNAGIAYKKKRARHYAKHGLADIEHLAFIHHIPCLVECKETKNLGYDTYLKEHYPELYRSELAAFEHCLLRGT